MPRLLLIVVVLAALGGAGWLLGLFDPAAVPGRGDPEDPQDRVESPDEKEKAVPGGQAPIEVAPFVPPDSPGELQAPAAQPSSVVLKGRVVAVGEGVPDVVLALHFDNSSHGRVHQTGELAASETSDAEGNFLFDAVPAGTRLILRAIHPEYQLVEVKDIHSKTPASLNQVIELAPGFTIAGNVGHVQGFPVNDARVTVYDLQIQAYEPEGQAERVAITDDDGNFLLTGIRPGMKQLVASHPILKTDVGKPFHLTGSMAGQRFTLIDGVEISGIVRDRLTMAPVPGARVLARQAGAQGTPGVAMRVLEAACDEEGNYTMTGLGRVSYELWARCDGYLVGTRATVQAPVAGLALDLVPGGEIAGVVNDKTAGGPVGGGDIFITANPNMVVPTRAYQSAIDSQGRFRFTGVPEGSFHLVVRVPGFAEAVHPAIPVQAGSRILDVAVEVGGGTLVEGRVVNEAGDPVEGAVVRFSRDAAVPGDPLGAFLGPIMREGAPAASGRTDPDGYYRVPGLSEGRWTMDVSHPRYASRAPSSVAVAGNPDRMEGPTVVLTVAGSIAGVVWTEGAPDSKARVSVIDQNGRPVGAEASTDQEGRFLFEGLSPGTYSVRVTMRRGAVDIGGLFAAAAGRGTATGVVVRAGQTAELTLKAEEK